MLANQGNPQGHVNIPSENVLKVLEYLEKLPLDNIEDEESTAVLVMQSIKDQTRLGLETLEVPLINLSDKLSLREEAIFLAKLLLFISYSQEIIAMVSNAALKRKSKGIPSLDEQNENEQLDHCYDHLNLWMSGEIGDEETVTDQAKHTVCRALLAYFLHETTRNANGGYEP